ncbi:MAG: hypothetical protein OEZ35_05150 [Candidatus Bathyarchaeota archaeon]|nr:hypothetical protein [Candidatus Bathyarchaeota archaeon]
MPESYVPETRCPPPPLPYHSSNMHINWAESVRARMTRFMEVSLWLNVLDVEWKFLLLGKLGRWLVVQTKAAGEMSLQ